MRPLPGVVQRASGGPSVQLASLGQAPQLCPVEERAPVHRFAIALEATQPDVVVKGGAADTEFLSRYLEGNEVGQPRECTGQRV